MTPAPIHERRAEFHIAVADLCRAAELAQLLVEIGTADGREIRGVPSGVMDGRGENEMDDTGYRATFCLGGASLRLDDVATCTVFSPLRPAPPS